ncbi:hypothetical protein BDV11DRAFT_201173 [Aspergillus similis]
MRRLSHPPQQFCYNAMIFMILRGCNNNVISKSRVWRATHPPFSQNPAYTTISSRRTRPLLPFQPPNLASCVFPYVHLVQAHCSSALVVFPAKSSVAIQVNSY